VLTFLRSPPRRRGTRGLPAPLGPGQKRLSRSGTRTCPARIYSAPILKNRTRCGTTRETVGGRLAAGARPGAGSPARHVRKRAACVGDSFSSIVKQRPPRSGGMPKRMYSSTRFRARRLADYWSICRPSARFSPFLTNNPAPHSCRLYGGIVGRCRASKDSFCVAENRSTKGGRCSLRLTRGAARRYRSGGRLPGSCTGR
jgi:hypothetical protein